jgi:hypothetical protein
MSERSTGFELMEGGPPEVLLPAAGLWPWFALAGGLLALVLALVMLGVVLRKRRRATDPQAARKAAYREAKARLEAMTPGDVREQAVVCSLTLRKYLSMAAGDPSLFETHEEFNGRTSAAEVLAGLDAGARGEVLAWFARLAEIKYAPAAGGADAAAVLAGSRRVLDILEGGLPR